MTAINCAAASGCYLFTELFRRLPRSLHRKIQRPDQVSRHEPVRQRCIPLIFSHLPHCTHGSAVIITDLSQKTPFSVKFRHAHPVQTISAKCGAEYRICLSDHHFSRLRRISVTTTGLPMASPSPFRWPMV